jgi:hypothetical protein
VRNGEAEPAAACQEIRSSEVLVCVVEREGYALSAFFLAG